jgi:hypothetical protein
VNILLGISLCVFFVTAMCAGPALDAATDDGAPRWFAPVYFGVAGVSAVIVFGLLIINGTMKPERRRCSVQGEVVNNEATCLAHERRDCERIGSWWNYECTPWIKERARMVDTARKPLDGER